MPITSPLSLNPISQKDFAQLDYKVMRHAYECQNQMARRRVQLASLTR